MKKLFSIKEHKGCKKTDTQKQSENSKPVIQKTKIISNLTYFL